MDKNEMLESEMLEIISRRPGGLVSWIEKHDWHAVESLLEKLLIESRKMAGIRLIAEKMEGDLRTQVWKILGNVEWMKEGSEKD